MGIAEHRQEEQKVKSQLVKRKGRLPRARVNAVELLIAQHREVEQLFSEFESLGANAYRKKQSIFKLIAEKLNLHAKLEETLFYPSVKSYEVNGTLEACEEHKVLKDLIRRIQRTKPTSENYKSKVKFLREFVERHVFEEEEQLFPIWQKAYKMDELEDVGQKMEDLIEKVSRKKQHLKRKKASARKRLH